MAGKLEGMRVAIVVSTDFEQVELTEPKKALEEAGATVMIISDHPSPVSGFHHDTKGDKFKVDMPLEQADPQQFDALMLPGGALNADELRMVLKARQLVEHMDRNKKPMAVICHAPWVLVSAGLVKNRKLTSWPTIQDDVRNAGGKWVDEEVVRDGNLVTSRGPRDLPAFNRAMIELFAEHRRR